MKYKLIILFIITFIISGCKEDKVTIGDNKAPEKPILLKHLGDTGDGRVNYVVETPSGLVSREIVVNDNNNGIDAVSEGNYIKLQWELFGSDLQYIRIYRAGLDGRASLIDSIRASSESYYIDEKIINNTFNTWNYHIEVVDNEGFSTSSDTVDYTLIPKAMLEYPDNMYNHNSRDSLFFKWRYIQVGNITKYRVLLFDDDGKLIWSKQRIDTEYLPVLDVFYDGPILPPGRYIWRVDAFGDEIYIESGSESNTRDIIIN